MPAILMPRRVATCPVRLDRSILLFSDCGNGQQKEGPVGKGLRRKGTGDKHRQIHVPIHRV
jgi:hypothetical protein